MTEQKPPTYVELVNLTRRLADALNGRTYYERVTRFDDSIALIEPRELVILGIEAMSLCRRIGPVPTEPTLTCSVCPCPPHAGECGRDVVVPAEMTSSASGGYVARCYCTHSSPISVPVRVCPRCSGPDDHGDECQPRDPIPTERTWDVESDR